MDKRLTVRHEDANKVEPIGYHLRDVIGLEYGEAKHLSSVANNFFGATVIFRQKIDGVEQDIPVDMPLAVFLQTYWTFEGAPNGLINFTFDEEGGLELYHLIPQTQLAPRLPEGNTLAKQYPKSKSNK